MNNNETSFKQALNAEVSDDDLYVRRLLLRCCSRLGMKNLAHEGECRTTDVADMLEESINQMRVCESCRELPTLVHCQFTDSEGDFCAQCVDRIVAHAQRMRRE